MGSNLAYQEERREEIINGKVVAMSPSALWHNYIGASINIIFRRYLKGKNCRVLPDSTTVKLSEENQFIPDVMIVCDRSKIKAGWVEGAPDLVVEILSHSTAKNDRFHKKDVYEQSGVPEYWIVDPVGYSVEVYLLQDGRYVLDEMYFYYPPEKQKDMTEEEKAALVTGFKCHLYDDLEIRLDEIFEELV